jgi:DNA-binding beta-propeller fold protein YncE
VALAGSQSVTLRWSPAISGVVGYHLERRVDDSTAWRPLASILPAYVTLWRDFGLADGIDHHYRIAYVFDRGGSPLTSEAVATPGPLLPWIADARSGLAQLTPDARYVSARVPLEAGAVSVDVDRSDGRTWACSADAGRVYVVDPVTSHPLAIPAAQPVAVVVNEGDHTAWVADYQGDQVLHLHPDGSRANPGALPGLDGALDVALGAGGSVWVCERNGNRVRHYDALGAPLGAVDMAAPSRVAVDSLTGDAWVSSFATGVVLHLSPDLARIDSLTGLAGPIGVAVDPRRRRLWVAEAVAGVVDVYDLGGARHARLAGLAEPRAVTIDRDTGNAWIVEHGAAAVDIVSPDGARVRRLAGVGEPWSLALDDLRFRLALTRRAAAAQAGAARPPRRALSATAAARYRSTVSGAAWRWWSCSSTSR